ncbi:MAG: ATP-binding protein [Desulfobulbaceae bacterium]|nr:ATP-binding protein [Desulfobulbaceae bacterium]
MTDKHTEQAYQVIQLQATIEQLRQENRRLQEKARHADSANKAKSDFLAMISHEIRTPMNGVIGLSELLLGTGLEERQKHFAELILASARNLLTLINSLLDFSKIEARKMILDMDPFDLRALLAEVMELFILSGRQKNLQVSSDIDPQLRSVYIGDGYRIRQILVNLLGNAIKFTEKGEVQLIVKVVESENNKDLLRFEVKDTGFGIVREKQGQLFQPFTQLDGPSSLRHSGTGLGLSICAKLIELMKGAVGLTSEPGQGSTFWFQVRLPWEVVRDASDPLSAGQSQQEKIPADSNNNSAEQINILIVDDEPTNRMVFRESLQKTGVHVAEAVDGREAVGLCAQTHFDLIFMDCQMPVMDGFESTVQILFQAEERSETPPPVVALTADATQATQQRCRDTGMVDYLLKPLDFDELQKVVGRFLPGLEARVPGRHVIVQEEEEGEQKKNAVVNPLVIEKLRQNIGDLGPVIKVYLKTIESRLQQIEAAVREKNSEHIARSAHTLKGSSSQFGAEELVGLCRRMENLGRERSITGTSTLLTEIQQASERLREVLSKELD